MTASNNPSSKENTDSTALQVRLIISMFLLILVSMFVSCEKETPEETKDKILTHEDSLALGLIIPPDTTTTPQEPPTPPAKITIAMIDGVNYKLNEDELTAEVTWKEDEYKGKIVIPEIVHYDGNDYSVVAIGESAFYDNRELLKVTVKGEKLKSVGAIAFVWCHSLSEVKLPNSVTEMGWRAFHNCGLTSISLPNSLTELPKEAFRACKSLKTIKLPDNLLKIGEQAFYDCSIESLTLPATVKDIGKEAFAFCNFNQIICYAKDVPKAEYSSFPFRKQSWGNWYNIDIYLYVPKQSISLYEESVPWKNCYSISAIEDGLLW